MATDRDEVAEVTLWAEGIEGIHKRFGGGFTGRNLAGGWEYLRGLLSPVERKNG